MTPALADNATSPPLALEVDGQSAPRDSELVEIIRAYNEVTDRLQQSHEHLTSEVARLQRELASANAALQRSRRLAALGEMAAGIAHEIRNPLASIQLYAGMLCEDLAAQPQQADLADKISAAVRGLNGIVGDVLTFAREIRLRPVEASPREALERAADAVRPLLDQHQVQMIIDPTDASAWFDPEMLHQALVNLIRNAAEAMAEAHTRTLTLAVEADKSAVRLIVCDTGPGIEDAAVDRIFNPFFTTRATGTGLGLAIVHRIIDAHGGTIGVHNDQGAVFTITLPQGPETDHDE
jgi:signal transduction histidine kinase